MFKMKMNAGEEMIVSGTKTNNKYRFMFEKGYEVLKFIGEGAYAEVVLARSLTTDKLYAVKILSRSIVEKKPFMQKYIDQEITIMKDLNHPNIVRYEFQFKTTEFVVIGMEYCPEGNLLSYQAKMPDRQLPLRKAIFVLVNILKGLKCIHEKGIIHRDIKSENVLLTKEKDQYLYKIADFGFACTIGCRGALTHCGTTKYMAPEILDKSYYDISVDIWALGVLFYFMVFREHPFKGHDVKNQQMKKCNPHFSLIQNVKKEKSKSLSHKEMVDLQDFFKKIFVMESDKRLTFSKIVKHPILAEYEAEFQRSILFYRELESKEVRIKDKVQDEEDQDNFWMEPEDGSKISILKKQVLIQSERALERELEELQFEIDRIDYLRECARQIYQTYCNYLHPQQRIAARYQLLKVYLFYATPLIQNLTNNEMPASLLSANISPPKWQECVKTQEYAKAVRELRENHMKTCQQYQDTFQVIIPILKDIPIRNFDVGFKFALEEKTFEELKVSYRSTTMHIFKRIRQNKSIDSHTTNKIKMRIFCCHMINRIFKREEVTGNFPQFTRWIHSKGIKYLNVFDFLYFKKWIHEETQENIAACISFLTHTFFHPA